MVLADKLVYSGVAALLQQRHLRSCVVRQAVQDGLRFPWEEFYSSVKENHTADVWEWNNIKKKEIKFS